MQIQPTNLVPRYFQDLAPQWARLALWQKKLTLVFNRLRGSTVQKISASDEGFLILNIYKPGAPRDAALISIQRSGSGLTLSGTRPATQPKPNGIVQLARKYLQGRAVTQVLLSIDPVAIIIEFSPVHPHYNQPPQPGTTQRSNDEPNCLIVDLDARPARICVATKHAHVPSRYASQCTGFDLGSSFFESHCEWSLESTKTKRRATFVQPLALSCICATPSAESDHALVTFSKEQEAVSDARKTATTTETDITLATALHLLPTHVRRAARTRVQFLERRLQRQKTDLPSTQHMDDLKQRAEALRANIYLWPKGFPQWHVPPDLISSAGLPAILTLKAGQSPGDMVTAAFEEIDKLSRRRTELEKRVEESRIAVERFYEQLIQSGRDLHALPEDVRNNSMSLARNVQDLVSVQRILTQLELNWSAAGERQAVLEAERARRLPYRAFRASSGEFIRVSKSANDADAMLKLMPSHHTWLHVTSGEGSHVWLEKPKGAKPSDIALKEASMLAIHYSKQTRAQEADVYVALRGDLDKRKDLAAGKVIVRRSEHRFVRYSQLELQSFLDQQSDS